MSNSALWTAVFQLNYDMIKAVSFAYENNLPFWSKLPSAATYIMYKIGDKTVSWGKPFLIFSLLLKIFLILIICLEIF